MCSAFLHVEFILVLIFLRDQLQNLHGFLLKCWSPQAILSHQEVIFEFFAILHHFCALKTQCY